MDCFEARFPPKRPQEPLGVAAPDAGLGFRQAPGGSHDATRHIRRAAHRLRLVIDRLSQMEKRHGGGQRVQAWALKNELRGDVE